MVDSKGSERTESFQNGLSPLLSCDNSFCISSWSSSELTTSSFRVLLSCFFSHGVLSIFSAALLCLKPEIQVCLGDHIDSLQDLVILGLSFTHHAARYCQLLFQAGYLDYWSLFTIEDSNPLLFELFSELEHFSYQTFNSLIDLLVGEKRSVLWVITSSSDLPFTYTRVLMLASSSYRLVDKSTSDLFHCGFPREISSPNSCASSFISGVTPIFGYRAVFRVASKRSPFEMT